MRIHVIMCEKGRDFMKREGRFIGRPDLIDPPDFKPAYEMARRPHGGTDRAATRWRPAVARLGLAAVAETPEAPYGR